MRKLKEFIGFLFSLVRDKLLRQGEKCLCRSEAFNGECLTNLSDLTGLRNLLGRKEKEVC